MENAQTTGQVFNLGGGINYSVNEIYDIIKGLLKTEIQPIYKDDLPGEAFENLADISLAKKIGWSPTTDIMTGMLESINYIRAEIESKRI